MSLARAGASLSRPTEEWQVVIGTNKRISIPFPFEASWYLLDIAHTFLCGCTRKRGRRIGLDSYEMFDGNIYFVYISYVGLLSRLGSRWMSCCCCDPDVDQDPSHFAATIFPTSWWEYHWELLSFEELLGLSERNWDYLSKGFKLWFKFIKSLN